MVVLLSPTYHDIPKVGRWSPTYVSISCISQCGYFFGGRQHVRQPGDTNDKFVVLKINQPSLS